MRSTHAGGFAAKVQIRDFMAFQAGFFNVPCKRVHGEPFVTDMD
jgi:hypothetical protein